MALRHHRLCQAIQEDRLVWTEPPLSHVWEAWGTHQPRLLPQMFNSQPNTRIEPRLSIATRQTPMMPTRSASANTKSWKCQMSVADGGRQRRRQARRVSHPATISSCCEIATRNSRTPSTVPTNASVHALTNFLFVLLQRIPCWYFQRRSGMFGAGTMATGRIFAWPSRETRPYCRFGTYVYVIVAMKGRRAVVGPDETASWPATLVAGKQQSTIMRWSSGMILRHSCETGKQMQTKLA